MRRYYKYGLENYKPKNKPGHKPYAMSTDKQKNIKRSGEISRFSLALLAALVFHGVLLLLLPLATSALPKPKKFIHTKVVFAKPKKEKKKTLKDASEQKQVVTIAPTKDQKRPERADYLAVYNQSTDKPQVAKHRSLTPKKISATPQKRGQQAKPKKLSKEASAKKPPKKIVKAKMLPLDNGLEAPSVDDYFEKKPDPVEDDPLGILPTFTGNGLVDAMPFADSLDDVEVGDKTELNAWQWRHAPFFNRIKSRIGRVWAPHQQIARYDPQGLLLGRKDRVTVVNVSIDQSGKLTDISVSTSSDVAYLDEEAKRAFRIASPFPFPPKALFKGKKLFTFEFAFHLQIDRGLSFDFEWNKGG